VPDHRLLKTTLYESWARLGKAIASPQRLELLDLLAQGEKSVDVIAGEAALTITNASAHLATLHAARLVDRRKAAQFVYYRLADPGIVALLRQLQELGRRGYRARRLRDGFPDWRAAGHPVASDPAAQRIPSHRRARRRA